VTDPPQSKTTSRSSGEQHRPFIEVEFGKRRNAVTIFQDLVEHRVYEGRYNAVKRFMRSLRSHESWVSCRFETSAAALGRDRRRAERVPRIRPGAMTKT